VLGVLALLAAVGSGVVGAAQVTDVPGIPCVACQALSVTPEQVAVIPEHLNGARVLVRVATGTPEPDWTSAHARACT